MIEKEESLNSQRKQLKHKLTNWEASFFLTLPKNKSVPFSTIIYYAKKEENI